MLHMLQLATTSGWLHLLSWLRTLLLPAAPYDPGEHGDPLHTEAPAEGGFVRAKKDSIKISHEQRLHLRHRTLERLSRPSAST